MDNLFVRRKCVRVCVRSRECERVRERIMRNSAPSPLDGFMFELMKQRQSSSLSFSETGDDVIEVDLACTPTALSTSRQCGGDDGCDGDADYFVISVVSDQAKLHSKKCGLADVLSSSRLLPFDQGIATTAPSMPRRRLSMGSICSTSATSSSFDDHRRHPEAHLPPQEMKVVVPQMMMVNWDPSVAASSPTQKICGVSRWVACLNSPRSRPGPILSSPSSSKSKQAAAIKCRSIS
jgi:hypothetical protein